MVSMDLVRFGRGIRALRIRRRWRQQDLADAAGVSRQKIARIEVGQSQAIPARDLEKVAQSLGARAEVRLSWNGEALDRLLDGEHARLIDLVAAMLRTHAWEVAIEVTFWIRGERGSVDILAWLPAHRIVLVVEVKSVVPDQQAMLMALDRKARLGLEIARERGWDGRWVARLLVIRASRTARRRVEAHPETYAAVFTHRHAAVRSWLRSPAPVQRFAGLLFVADAHTTSTRHRVPKA
jgi:transcriptional regulator with XRE-family HTH domain